MKDVEYKFRLERGLREEFLAVCKANDVPAAQVLRGYMRSYIREQLQVQADQGDLFSVAANE